MMFLMPCNAMPIPTFNSNLWSALLWESSVDVNLILIFMRLNATLSVLLRVHGHPGSHMKSTSTQLFIHLFNRRVVVNYQSIVCVICITDLTLIETTTTNNSTILILVTRFMILVPSLQTNLIYGEIFPEIETNN